MRRRRATPAEAELGADALILGTRRVAGGVEITAALDWLAANGPSHGIVGPVQRSRTRIRAASTFSISELKGALFVPLIALSSR